MNECVKKVLFGAQRQASKQNDAIVSLVARCISPDELHTEEEVVSSIVDKITAVSELYNELKEGMSFADEMFVRCILGEDGVEAIVSGEDFELRQTPVGTNGKIDFYLVPHNATSSVAMKLKAEEDWRNSKSYREAASKEDYADELIRKILAVTPPAKRAELPEDDARAALCVSKEYWSTNS